MEVKSSPTFMPQNNSSLYVIRKYKILGIHAQKWPLWAFFWGRWKLDTSDCHQILHGGTVTCPLGGQQIILGDIN